MIRNYTGIAKGSAASAVRRNSEPENQKITDAELLTIYFYCRIHENKHSKTDIYDYALRYLISWFPGLPTYANFNARPLGGPINAMDSAVMALVPMVIQSADFKNDTESLSERVTLTDSLPVMLCSGKRQGRVAPELSDKAGPTLRLLRLEGTLLLRRETARDGPPRQRQYPLRRDGRSNARFGE
ncbi:hypothetical protein [Persicitalea sp.]|uniref:hypothetical protein n=1 Tax=Persicitalea sp. TaxID=3100273 RepID=UPI003593FCEA